MRPRGDINSNQVPSKLAQIMKPQDAIYIDKGKACADARSNSPVHRPGIGQARLEMKFLAHGNSGRRQEAMTPRFAPAPGAK